MSSNGKSWLYRRRANWTLSRHYYTKLRFRYEWLPEQEYDNGANMIEKDKGVQARILRQFPKPFFNSCGCHSLNLVVADTVKKYQDLYLCSEFSKDYLCYSPPQWSEGI